MTMLDRRSFVAAVAVTAALPAVALASGPRRIVLKEWDDLVEVIRDLRDGDTVEGDTIFVNMSGRTGRDALPGCRINLRGCFIHCENGARIWDAAVPGSALNMFNCHVIGSA